MRVLVIALLLVCGCASSVDSREAARRREACSRRLDMDSLRQWLRSRGCPESEIQKHYPKEQSDG